MRRRLPYVIALLVALALPTAASADDPAIFFTVCPESHRAPDDPIVFPGQPGAAHSHDFAGAWSTNAFSTYDSLRSSGTTCDLPKDTAGYWTPTLSRDGQRVPLLGTFAYFTDGIHLDRASVKAFPPGLKVVADMSARPRASGWHCGDARLVEDGGTMSNTTIPTCPGGDAKLQSYVEFPECWDGKNLDSPNHRSHMAYAQRNAAGARIGCPSTHPVPVPQLGLKTRYDSYGGSGFTLSSGAPSTMHADFFNSWDQAELERLVKRCINDPYRNGEPCRGEGNYTPNPNYPNASSGSTTTPPPSPAPTEPNPTVSPPTGSRPALPSRSQSFVGGVLALLSPQTAPNKRPVARFGLRSRRTGRRARGATSSTVRVAVDGTRSYDPDGKVVRFRWYVEGASRAVCTRRRCSLKLRDRGALKLVVTDNRGARDSKVRGISGNPS